MSYIGNTGIPNIPPSPTQDIFSVGVQKVRERINKQRHIIVTPAPTHEELKRKQQGMIQSNGRSTGVGSRSEVPFEFETGVESSEIYRTQTLYDVDGRATTTQYKDKTVDTSKKYTSPSDRIDRDIWIIEPKTLKKVKLPFVPRELKYTPESNFKAIASMGRNTPLYHYTGGEDTLEFEIDWFAEKEHRYDVIQNCKWLESLSKNDGYDAPPSPVILHWNVDLFSDSIWLITAAPYRLLDFQAHRNMLPQQAYQQVTLKRTTATNLKRADIQAFTI